VLINDDGEVLADAEGKPIRIVAGEVPSATKAEPVAAGGPTPPVIAEDPAIAALRAELAAERTERERERAAREAEKQAEAVAKVRAESAALADGLVAAHKLLPAGRDHLAALAGHVKLAAAGLPTDGLDAPAALDALVAGLPAHNLGGEVAAGSLPAGARVLDNAGAGDAPTRADPAVVARMLAATSVGVAAGNGAGNGTR
jgi:hypothetical protein